MKWMQIYLAGYVIVLGGLIAALWKMGVIERVGAGWTPGGGGGGKHGTLCKNLR